MSGPTTTKVDVYRTADGRIFEVADPYYLASCDACGWVGSTELCGGGYWADDEDVYCPDCHRVGADIGKVAEAAKVVEVLQPDHATLTASQAAALKWLREHNGDGVFDRNGVLLAAGEMAPVMRSTWNALRDLGHVEFYLNNRRVRIVEQVAG